MSSEVWIKRLEKVTLITGTIGPLTVIPQIYKIYYLKNATGVSPVSWFAFALLDIPFILYGILRKDRPIVNTYALWFIANIIVAVGAIVYN